MLNAVIYKSCGAESLDEIHALWEKLNAHHASLSPHFGEVYTRKTFAERKQALLQQASSGLHVVLALSQNEQAVAYGISTINSEHIGEIDSLYVVEDYRGTVVADTLMKLALDWLRDQGVTRTRLAVAAGNERVFKFYARYGFYPAKVILEQMPNS